jgi:hypothetical protein
MNNRSHTVVIRGIAGHPTLSPPPPFFPYWFVGVLQNASYRSVSGRPSVYKAYTRRPRLKPSSVSILPARLGSQLLLLLHNDVLFGFNFTLHANPEQTLVTWSNSCFSFSPLLATSLSEPYPHSASRLGAGYVTMVIRKNKQLPLYYSTKKHRTV